MIQFFPFTLNKYQQHFIIQLLDLSINISQMQQTNTKKPYLLSKTVTKSK